MKQPHSDFTKIRKAAYWKNSQHIYQGANTAFLALIGQKTADFLLGKSDLELAWQAYSAQILENDNTTFENKIPGVFEETLIDAKGQILKLQVIKTPIFDSENRVLGLLNIVDNIANLKAHQEDLEILQSEHYQSLFAEKNQITIEYSKAKAYLKSIVSNLPDHVFWEDLNGNLLGCNDQQAKSFGYNTAEEILGKNVIKLGEDMGWDKDMVENLRKNDQRVMSTGEIITAEESLIFSNGRECVMYSRKAPLKDENGNIIGMLGLAFDITERKKMEENLRIAKEKAEEANIAKSNFIANISHDLRSPLHAMLGTTELMQINPNSENRDEMINTILSAGKNLLKLIENILNYSEIESSQKTQFSDNFDLRHLIESIVIEHTHSAEVKNIALMISYSDFVPHYVVSHMQNIRRILGNLIENAIKFTESGHVLIAVECLATHEDYADLQIVVEDTGIGIGKNDIEHIFDRFYRATPAHINKYKGSGLGLAIIKQLTEAMGGSVKVNSQLGFGTTFCCTIPFRLTEKIANGEALRNHFQRARVLVIDDHKQRRQTLLKQFPGNNITAVNSRSALSAFNSAEKTGESFNLVIMDEDLETGAPEKLTSALIENSSLPIAPLMILCRKINGNIANEEQRKLFKLILKKPLAPSDIAGHIAPEWQNWLDMLQRKTHIAREKKLNVLLVEDDPLIQKFTMNLLRDSGCNVELAATGRAALEKHNNDYDLILMDIGLPDINGLTVTEELRHLMKDHAKQPIIAALTAHVSNDDRERCLKSGLDDFLKKPASYHDFQELLNKYF